MHVYSTYQIMLTRVHLANNILVHIIMLLFKSHPVAFK